MSQTASRLVFLSVVVGLLASGAAAYVHARMLSDPTYTSFCDVSATVSCTQVYASRFGTFHGIPVAVFGAIWFVFAGLLAVAGVAGPAPVRESAPGYLFAGSTVALAVVLYLAYASFVVLKLVCVLCLTTYAAVLGLFLVTGAAATFPMMSLPRRAVADLKLLLASPAAIAVAVLFLGGAAATLALFPREVSASAVAGGQIVVPQDQRSELERFLSTAPRIPLVVPSDGAKVLIVKFNDFQCPACGQSYLAYKPILAKYESAHPGEVKMVLKDYPLNPDCNPNLSQMMHQGACDAAVAVRLARLHGRGNQLEDWLYTHQEQMTPQTVRQAAREVGQITDFDAKYAATLASVKSDIALGKQLNVTQTPTFFINGVKIDGAWAPQFFDQAIAYELQRASANDDHHDMPALAVHELTKDYAVGFWRKRPYRALDALTLDVEAGEVFGFLGPNGAGKTTTLKLLMGLVFPTSGSAELLGRPLGDVAVKQRIGYLPENPYLYDHLTAEELLGYYAGLFGYSAADRRARVTRLLDEVGIGAERRLQLRKFSKGMLQRVGIAQALVNDPELVVFDEPMSGLDPLGRREVRALILGLRDRGCTVFFSSHVLSDAEALCDRVAILARGRLVASGRLHEMLAFDAQGWELVAARVGDGLARALEPQARRVVRIGAERYTFELPVTVSPDRILADLAAGGATLVSLNPIRATLEDFFVQQVTQSDVTSRDRGLGSAQARPGGPAS